MLMEALFRWSASAGQLGLGPGRFLGEDSLESSGRPGDRQKKPGRHGERICFELAACLGGGVLAGSHSLLMASPAEHSRLRNNMEIVDMLENWPNGKSIKIVQVNKLQLRERSE